MQWHHRCVTESAPWLVVGLGNPGPGFSGNRHNIGAVVVEALARRAGVILRAHKARAMVAQLHLGSATGGAPGPAVVLALPRTYMNDSGRAVAALLRFFSTPVDRLVVVHDELDVDAGRVRLKFGGGEGGHNGLRSISAAVGTREYLRVRVGIGRPPGRTDPADFVLHDFSPGERKALPFLVEDAADAVEMLITVGLLEAQQRFHAPSP